MPPPTLAYMAQQRRWLPDDPLALEIISKRIAEGQPATIVQQQGMGWVDAPEHLTVLEAAPVDPDPSVPLVIISDRLLGPRPEVDRLVILRPPTLTLGVASRRELHDEELNEALRLFCRKAGYSQQSIMAVAASARRRSLAVLDDLADRLKAPLLFYEDHILNRTPLGQPGKMAGTCAVAAILAAGVKAVEVDSTPFFGKLCLALARRPVQLPK
ncbi:MAG: cobalamin biosynthesis protein [Gemmatales bacterium]